MHKIQYPIFDFHFQYAVNDTREVQNMTSDLVKNMLLPVVESVLNEFELKGVTVRIEEIALDLGNFTLDTLRSNAPEKLRGALRDAISDKFSQNRFELKQSNVEEMPETDNLFELLVHYLSSGRGSWRSSNFSKELEKFLSLQNIDYKKKDKKLGKGALGETVGTLAHTFDFENFLEVIRLTSPEILELWFQEFGQDDTIQKRLARQVKAEILWQWIGGLNSISPIFLERLYETIKHLNKYTWKMPEVRIKSLLSETLLAFFAKGMSIKDMTLTEIDSIFFVLLQKIDNLKNYDGFFEKYQTKINTFLHSFSTEHIFYAQIKGKYEEFLFDKKEIILKSTNIKYFLDTEIKYFTNQSNIIKKYFTLILNIFQEEDEIFIINFQKILLTYLKNNIQKNINYQILVNDTFESFFIEYKKYINQKYKQSKNIRLISKVWDKNFTTLKNEIANKIIKIETIKNINQIYDITNIDAKIIEIQKKEQKTIFEKIILEAHKEIQKETPKNEKIDELIQGSAGRQGTLPENKLMEILAEIEPTETQNILTFIRELALKYTWAKVSAVLFRQKIWQLVAEYFINYQHVTFDFERFTKYVLTEIQTHYAIEETKMIALLTQMKIIPAEKLGLEQWRYVWKNTKNWDEVVDKIFNQNGMLIEESYMMRIAFAKYDVKLIKLAQNIAKVLTEYGAKITYQEILKDWLAYRWLLREKTFNFQKEVLNLLEIVISYKNTFANREANKIQNFIQKIATYAKINNENIAYLQDKYLEENTKNELTLENINTKTVAEIMAFLQNTMPTKIAWIKNIQEKIYTQLTERLEIQKSDFEKSIFTLIAYFVLENKKELNEKNILAYLFEKLKENDLHEITFFYDFVEKIEINKKYVLKNLIHFIENNEWLWTNVIQNKTKKTDLTETLSTVLHDNTLSNTFYALVLNIDHQKIVTFTKYVFENVKKQEIIQLYSNFLKKIAQSKETNVKEFIDFIQSILLLIYQNKYLENMLKDIFTVYVQKNIENIYLIDLLLNLEDKTLYKIFQNIKILIQKIDNDTQKNQILKEQELKEQESEEQELKEQEQELKEQELKKAIENVFQEIEIKEDQEEKSDKIWLNFPIDTFANESVEKQAQILIKFLKTPTQILTLLTDLLENKKIEDKKIENNIPETIILSLNLSNLTEVLRLFFPDILLIWFDSLPAPQVAEVGKVNKRATEYYEKQIKIFGKDIQIINDKIQNETYLPADTPEKTQKSKEELKELAKKLDKATKKWIDEPLYVQNAGMVILHPFLMRLFDMLKLTEKNQFKTEWEASKAVYMLEYLVRKEYEEIDEANLILNKILCGIPIHIPLWKEIKLTDQEKELGETLLQAVIQNWGVLGKASPDSLRYGFLQREGRLTPEGDAWRLRVEQKGMDILVESLPWTLSMIKNPLMKGFIYTEWT